MLFLGQNYTKENFTLDALLYQCLEDQGIGLGYHKHHTEATGPAAVSANKNVREERLQLLEILQKAQAHEIEGKVGQQKGKLCQHTGGNSRGYTKEDRKTKNDGDTFFAKDSKGKGSAKRSTTSKHWWTAQMWNTKTNILTWKSHATKYLRSAR